MLESKTRTISPLRSHARSSAYGMRKTKSPLVAVQFPRYINFDPYAPSQNDYFGESELIKAMKQGDRVSFCALYEQQAAQSRVNCFMYSVFVYGRNWHATLKQPEFVLDKDSSGKTLLHYAAVGGVNLSEGYFKNFVLPRTVGKQDSHGSTAMMLAAAAGNSNAVAVLRDFEAGIIDADGCSALMYASKFGRRRCIELLLQDECWVKDNRGFVFMDYLAPDVDADFQQRLASRLHCAMKEYVPPKTKIQVENEQLQALPPFYEFEKQYHYDIEKMRLTIEQRISESVELQRSVTVEPVIRIQDNFLHYLEEQVFPKIQYELTEFLAANQPATHGSYYLNRNAAGELITRVKDFQTELLARLHTEQRRALQVFSVQVEKIHLVLLYKQNDLHEDFDAIFSKLYSAEEGRNAQLQECVKTVNRIAYGNVRFSRAKELCIKCATEFQEFGDRVYENVVKAFQDSMDAEHDRLDAEIARQIDVVSESFVAHLKEQFDTIIRDINDRMMVKIDENILIRINYSIKKTEAFATSQMPDISQIKNHLNCLTVMIRNSRRIVSYRFYTAIYELATQFLTTETGLLEFVGYQGILPIRDTIPSYAFVAEYFAVFHKQFYFTANQLIQAMVHELAIQFSPVIEKQFVAFLQKFFLDNRTDDIPRIVCQRYGTLKKQRVNILDYLGDDLEVGFAYFYLSVVAQLSKCEMILYSETQNITASYLVEDQYYVGTYKVFQPASGKTYRCISPGWMYMDQRNEIEILVEPQFECTEDI